MRQVLFVSTVVREVGGRNPFSWYGTMGDEGRLKPFSQFVWMVGVVVVVVVFPRGVRCF